jgi:GntR family transcriptional regulator, vanillate catabolism transcriptional regulator
MARDGLISKVRALVLTGVLKPGERVTEVGLAKILHVSRTPIRSILPALAKEGLLVEVGKRGYAVKVFDPRDSLDGLTIRSALEGIAARKVAEVGPSPALLKVLGECLARGDAIFSKRYLASEDEQEYSEMNESFHSSIVAEAGSDLISDFYMRVNLVPFVAPRAIAFDKVGHYNAFELLFYAHRQHHAVAEAILSGDKARAEMLFREHAFTQRASMGETASSDLASGKQLQLRAQTYLATGS